MSTMSTQEALYTLAHNYLNWDIYPPGFTGIAKNLSKAGMDEDKAYYAVRYAHRGFQYGAYLALPLGMLFLRHPRLTPVMRRLNPGKSPFVVLTDTLFFGSVIGTALGASAGYIHSSYLPRQDLSTSVQAWKTNFYDQCANYTELAFVKLLVPEIGLTLSLGSLLLPGVSRGMYFRGLLGLLPASVTAYGFSLHLEKLCGNDLIDNNVRKSLRLQEQEQEQEQQRRRQVQEAVLRHHRRLV